MNTSLPAFCQLDLPALRRKLKDAEAKGSALAAPTGEGEHARLGPIVLMDVGDNIGGGSSADSTIILAEAQRTGFTGLLQTLYDPEAVEACVRGLQERGLDPLNFEFVRLDPPY